MISSQGCELELFGQKNIYMNFTILMKIMKNYSNLNTVIIYQENISKIYRKSLGDVIDVSIVLISEMLKKKIN